MQQIRDIYELIQSRADSITAGDARRFISLVLTVASATGGDPRGLRIAHLVTTALISFIEDLAAGKDAVLKLPALERWDETADRLADEWRVRYEARA